MSDAGSLINSYIMLSKKNRDRKEFFNEEAADSYYDALTEDQKEVLRLIDEQINKDNHIVSEYECPECGRNFTLITINDIELDVCVYCKSYWFDAGELAKMTGVRQDVPSQKLRHRTSKYTCPHCSEIMKEYVFLQPHNLLVDRCPKGCGVYLESGELKRAFWAAAAHG